MTELEYDEAVRLEKPRLCYLASDESPILKGHIEKDPDKLRKLQEFLSRVKREVVMSSKIFLIWLVESTSTSEIQRKLAFIKRGVTMPVRAVHASVTLNP